MNKQNKRDIENKPRVAKGEEMRDGNLKKILGVGHVKETSVKLIRCNKIKYYRKLNNFLALPSNLLYKNPAPIS